VRVKTDAPTEIYGKLGWVKLFLPSARFQDFGFSGVKVLGPETENVENVLTVKKKFSPVKFTVNFTVKFTVSLR
jgi:hypothetical protein